MSPRPWFREFDGWWYVQVRLDGKRRQVKLTKGRDSEDEAIRRWHKLMSEGDGAAQVTRSKADCIVGLIDLFLDHCHRNLAVTTYELYGRFLSSFCKTIDRKMAVVHLKPFHVSEWLSRQSWNNSTKNGAVRCIKRAFRWALDEGYIEKSPIATVKAVPATRRETILTPEDFHKVLSCFPDVAFRDYLLFLWHTGARPQEICKIELRHVDVALRRIVFPASESKGKKAPRVIYLSDAAVEVVQRHLTNWKGRPMEGPIFRNRIGKPWNRNAIRCRFRRIREKTGLAFCAYHFRHTFATNALQNLDPITVSVLMGHSDATTLARTYQHLAKKPEYLQKAAQQAITSQPNVLETDGRDNG